MRRLAALALIGALCAACGDDGAGPPTGASPVLGMAQVRPGEPRTGRVLLLDITAGTEEPIRLGDGSGDSAIAFSWSPDASRIAETRSLGMRQGDAFVYEATDIWIAGADGRNTSRLTRGEDGFAPVWARDGTAIVLTHMTVAICGSDAAPPSSTSALWVVPADGGPEARLTNPPVGSIDLAGSFSPDGKTLAFTRCETGVPSAAEPVPTPCAVLLIGSDGRDERLLAARAQDPEWTPDGGTIIYASDRDENGVMITGSDESGFPFDLYRVAAAGGAPVNFTRTRRRSETEPRISPGGQLLAFTARQDNDFDQRVLIANSDGTCRHQLKPDTTMDAASQYSSPGWRPGDAREERRSCD